MGVWLQINFFFFLHDRFFFRFWAALSFKKAWPLLICLFKYLSNGWIHKPAEVAWQWAFRLSVKSCLTGVVNRLIGWQLNLSYKLRCYKSISSLEKCHNKTCEKLPYFSSVFDIANHLLNVTRLSCHSVRLRNERQSLHHSQSNVVCGNFLGLWRHWKILITCRQ